MKKKKQKEKKLTTSPNSVGSKMDGSKSDPSDVPEPKNATTPATATAGSASSTNKEPATNAACSPSPAEAPVGASAQTESKISRYVSFGLLLGIIVLVGFFFYEVMAGFLVPLFLAAILVVVFRPLHRWLLEKMSGREKLAALATTLSVLLSVLVPIAALFAIAGAEGHAIIRQFNATKVTEGVKQIRTNLKLDMPSQANLTLINSELAKLQDEPASTAFKSDAHLTLLFEIERYAESLAQEQGLPWPEKPANSIENNSIEDSQLGNDTVKEPQTSVPKTDWGKFIANLDSSRTLHSKIQFAANETADVKLKRLNQSHEYQVQVNKTAEHFLNFKTELLGGKSKARWIQLANPSNDQMTVYASQFVSFLKNKLPQIGGAGISYAISLIVGTAIMIIAFYFFLLDGPKMIESFKGLSPIDDEHEQELVSEFSKVSRAVVVATLLSALAQGILAGIGFYFCGLESLILLTVLSAVLAMVPFVGAAAVWFPCCLYLYFFDNNMTAAIGLALYGVAVISMADNLIKPFILHGQSNLHPLFALLSVIGGVAALGPIGILIGPMIVAFLQTLLKILQREMTDMEKWAHDHPSG